MEYETPNISYCVECGDECDGIIRNLADEPLCLRCGLELDYVEESEAHDEQR